MLNVMEPRPRLINCNCQKTEKVPIHKKPPNLLAGLKACPRKGEERMEWDGGRKALSEFIIS